MEILDNQTRQQIWQRVFAPIQEPVREDLVNLLTQAARTMGMCRVIAGTVPTGARQQAGLLYQGARENVLCLEGICRLAGRKAGKFCTLPAETGRADRLLEICYHRCRQAMGDYTARSADPAFGAVFREMARREGENCWRIAWILGAAEP